MSDILYASSKDMLRNAYFFSFYGNITDEMDEKMQERFVRAMIYPPYPPEKYKGNVIETFKELTEIKGV